MVYLITIFLTTSNISEDRLPPILTMPFYCNGFS
nr:MAG TPA: hypothetical protein [Caudoviricetes sp.]